MSSNPLPLPVLTVEPFSAAWKDVKCADCGAEYRCSPASDYFHRPDVLKAGTMTLENGVCEPCLLYGGLQG